MYLPDVSIGPVEFVADACAGCLRAIPDDVPALFCTPWCREVCETVRWMRRVTADAERLSNPETLRAFYIRLGALVAGGYQRERRRIPFKVRQLVIDRANGRCEKCGVPGVEVDHIRGPSPDPANLQLLCGPCHAAKTDLAFFGPAGFQPPDWDAAVESSLGVEPDPIVVHVAARVEADAPLLPGDHDDWANTWRRRTAERRQRQGEHAAQLGLDAASLRGLSFADIAVLIADTESEVSEDAASPSDFDGGYGPDSYFARAMARDD